MFATPALSRPFVLDARSFERRADAERAFRAENAPSSPFEALRGLIIAAESGLLEKPAARRATAIAAGANAPMAKLFLQNAVRARCAGVELRLILALQPRWSWWRSPPAAAALDVMGPQRLRLLDARHAKNYYEQAVFGLSAQWSGARIGSRGQRLTRGSFHAIEEDQEGRKAAAIAHSSLEAVWSIARTV